jgi:hypothetical protein
MEWTCPAPADQPAGGSSVSLSFHGGNTLCVCVGDDTLQPDGECKLQLAPGMAIVIGRQEGGPFEYLDPDYSPTRILPNTGRPVVRSHEGRDNWVSRGHFTLFGAAQGIRFLNGVPKAGGGVRPHTNWTWLLGPVHTLIDKGAELLIERGKSITIGLPNNTIVVIGAD